MKQDESDDAGGAGRGFVRGKFEKSVQQPSPASSLGSSLGSGLVTYV